MRQRSTFIKERCRDLAQWFLEHHLSFVARYFAFDDDLNATLDDGEIQSALIQRLRPLVVDGVLSMADAVVLAQDATSKMIQATDLDGNGVISPEEFNICLERIAAVEADMVQAASRIRSDPALLLRPYSKALPRAKLTTVIRMWPQPSLQEG